jgi:hypothetical protein
MMEFYNQKLSRIKALIQQTNSEQQYSWALEKFLRSQSSKLHRSIDTGAGDPVESLIGFVRQYINSSPIDLAEFKRNTIEANIEGETEVLFNIATDYFLKPLDITDQHTGLLMLMDAAYLSHRLLEEINDHFLANSGITLSDTDNTHANLIMHSLIGENFANELDTAVYYSTEIMMADTRLFRKPSFLQFSKSRLSTGSAGFSPLEKDGAVHLSFSSLD